MATHGRFVWSDLGTDDLEAAREFYRDVFGWETRDAAAGEDDVYFEFTKDGQVVAGLYPLDDDQQPPNWTSYVAVDDASAVCATVTDRGGSVILEPTQYGDQGTAAMIEDPTGGVVGLWQAGTHEGADVFNEPGSMCWNELATRDLDTAKTFYADVLGWDLHDEDFGGFDYTTIVLDDDPNGGMFAMGEAFPAEHPPYWAVYMAVEDADDTLDRVREAGGEVVGEAQDTPFGRVATVVDPVGARLRIIQLAEDPTGPG